ncbi:glucuronide transporter [Paraoerskovia marina]|uniref:glucuronide transporter n=1 Tax=Paraoerskovia marina TaxID=545619 RepID=UPI0009DF8C47|nr:glucuronide transporter [Paraoerskovia marina]
MTTVDDATSRTAGTSPALPRLTAVNILGYGAGDAANNLAFMLATSFLLVYYTDVVGIGAAAAGTLFLVVRIFDAFTDVVAGRIVDRTNTRFGKFRPYLLFGALPLLLLSVATFNVPELGETGTLLYAYLTYTLLGIAYTIVNIPYGSLASAMTQDASDRAKLASARTLGAAIVGSLLAAVLTPMLSKDNDMQAVFTNATLAFVVVGGALYMFTFLTTKERVARDVTVVTMRQTVETLRGNRALALLCLSSFLLLTGMFAKSTAQIYLMRDVFDALELVAPLSIAQLFGIFAIAPFVPKIVRRWGKRNAYIGAGFVAAGGSFVAFVAPNVWVAFAALLVSMPGLLLINMLIWALEADTVEYGEWKTGVRTEGVTYGAFSFTRKAGQAVGGAMAAYALAIGGYVGSEQVQTAAAEWGIRAAAALVPGIFALAAALIMMAYPLTDAVHARIVAEIAERRAARTDAAQPDGGGDVAEGGATTPA